MSVIAIHGRLPIRDPLPLSALNDYLCCRRRVALKFIEDQHPGTPLTTPDSTDRLFFRIFSP